MLGKAGVIGLFSKKVSKSNKSYLHSYLDKLNGKEEDVLTYSDNPIAVWIFGGCTILVGLVMLWHILFNVEHTLFSSFHQGTWWQYLITFGILALGISFLFFGFKTEVEINKLKDIVSVKQINIFGQNKIKRRRASDCIAIYIEKKGSDTVANYTITYEIVLEFEDNTPFRILETQHRSQAKKQYVQIAKYLDLDFKLDDVPIKDKTIRAQAREAKETKEKEKKKE